MPEAIMDAAPIVIGGVVLALLGGIVWGVRQIHGLLYKATNGDDDSLVTILTGIAKTQGESRDAQRETRDAIGKHHDWSVAWAEEAESRSREALRDR